MKLLTDTDKEKFRILFVKFITLLSLVGMLYGFDQVINALGFTAVEREILHDIDFWGTVGLLVYFLASGFWDLFKL